MEERSWVWPWAYHCLEIKMRKTDWSVNSRVTKRLHDKGINEKKIIKRSNAIGKIKKDEV